MIKLSLETVIFDIVYGTIREYKNREQFKKYKLEDYDNWKDELITRIINYLDKHYEMSPKE